MPMLKTAIAVPEDLLREVDRCAAARGESRSRFINVILRKAVLARRDAEITKKLNILFTEDATREEQLREARELDSVGTPWSDEEW